MTQELKWTMPSVEGRAFSMTHNWEGIYHVSYFDKYKRCSGDFVSSEEMVAICAGVAWVENGKKKC